MLDVSSYFSIFYLAVLLPATITLYVFLPKNGRRILLLCASYCFFWMISGKLLVYLLLTTVSVHYFGLWLSDAQRASDSLLSSIEEGRKREIRAQEVRKQRIILAIAIISQLSILVVLKYAAFFSFNINHLLNRMGCTFQLNIPEFLLPVGISFYTLQAIAYLVDVYWKKISADTNLFRLALFMSFFPQIMEGPICRYSDTAEQLWNVPKITYHNFQFGTQRIFYGIMKKLIVADRLNLFIKTVFENYENYDGFVIAAAAVGYTFQLYMEFSGTMDLVIGSAEIFGISIPENFRRPFFSATIAEFWKRWHITLGIWFKNYLFYPLSMSRPLKKLTLHARKKFGNHYGPLFASAVALLAVWLCNGLWHGAGWNYIFFGMYHFALILGGSIIAPVVVYVSQKFHLSRNSIPYRGMQMIRTGIFVCIGELFFRAKDFHTGLEMLKKIVTDFHLTTIRDRTFFNLGMEQEDIILLLIFAMGIMIIGIMQEKGYRIRQIIASKSLVVQYTCFYAVLLIVIIFGAYGTGYIPVNPIYAGF